MTVDPFNDDFYFHNLQRKKQEKAAEAAAAGNMGLSPPPVPAGNGRMPLPVWKETKEIAAAVKADLRGQEHTRASEFQKDQKTLGMTLKRNTARPKQLLTFEGAEQGAEAEQGFKTQLWKARRAVGLATDALLRVHELRYLMNLPDLAPQKRAEIMAQFKDDLCSLGESLGLRGVREAGDAD